MKKEIDDIAIDDIAIDDEGMFDFDDEIKQSVIEEKPSEPKKRAVKKVTVVSDEAPAVEAEQKPKSKRGSNNVNSEGKVQNPKADGKSGKGGTVLKGGKSPKGGAVADAKKQPREKKQYPPATLQEIDSVSDAVNDQYLAVAQSYYQVSLISKAQANTTYKINDADMKFESGVLSKDGRDASVSSAKFSFAQSFVNVILDSFIFGFLVYFLTAIFQQLVRKKKDFTQVMYKSALKGALYCGLINLAYGCVICLAMFFVTTYAPSYCMDADIALYIQLIATCGLFFITFCISLIAYNSRVHSFKQSLWHSVKMLIWPLFYLVFITFVQLIASGYIAVVTAIVARLLLIFLIETAQKEKQQKLGEAKE